MFRVRDFNVEQFLRIRLKHWTENLNKNCRLFKRDVDIYFKAIKTNKESNAVQTSNVIKWLLLNKKLCYKHVNIELRLLCLPGLLENSWGDLTFVFFFFAEILCVFFFIYNTRTEQKSEDKNTRTRTAIYIFNCATDTEIYLLNIVL